VHERRATIPHFFRRIDVNKMIAIVFGNEKAAYEGVQALSALDREGSIDVALLWGPLGGYFAAQHGDLLTVTPLVHEAKSSRMDYYIAMGVRPGEAHWKRDIDKLIAENKDQIEAILRKYHVPQLDVQGNLVQ